MLGILLAGNYYVVGELTHTHQQIQQILFITLSIVEYIIYVLIFVSHKKINDRIYNFAAWAMSSYPNFSRQTEGHRWTNSIIVKSRLKMGDLFIDKFRFDQTVKNQFYWFSGRKWFENFDCKIKSKDMVKSGIIFGQMGAGKSEFYYSVIAQNTFNRYFIYDSKGDFTQLFYKAKRDIILNPYDARCSYWNPFEEAEHSEQVIDIFMTNLFSSIAGNKKDFFSASSKQRYMDIFNEIAYKVTWKNPKEKMQLFIDQLHIYFSKAQDLSQNSEKDIISTMRLTFDFFEYLNFCIQQEDVKTFTINEFLDSKNSKLILLDREEYKGVLIPFFTGFIATFNAILLSREDNKEDLTLLAIDEYLTFAKNIDETTLEGMHTRLRSKGGCLLPGVQYFPRNNNDELTQKLLNSATYWFIFQGIDEYTLDKINKTIGKVRYQKTSDETSPNKKYEGQTAQTLEQELINPSIIQELGRQYEHITFIPSRKILYKGYTPQVKLDKINTNFIKNKNMAKFWMQK
ncbi:type IV secretion system DNA-binding domain-containing protein [Patescibacteria group bacterium]|nr:type IV secretion system DNA-binding domain-containing protein [Patescibacteria group bacterium]